MRVAFLCKRRYMGKDVILDRYARLYELPYQLARKGHTVHCFCLGYQGQPEAMEDHEAPPGDLVWYARSLGVPRLPRLAGYPHWLLARLRAFAPDVIYGASDIPHVALTGWLARKLKKPYAIDLYDNFEGFGQARIPGFKHMLHRASHRADLVTTTSEALRELVIHQYAARGRVLAMPSTVDLAVFRPRDPSGCRGRLGLPNDALLVGTAGGLYADKGVGVLYAAWNELAARNPRAHLVLAGPSDPALPPPQDKRVHHLGMLSHADIAELFCALDVGVIYLRDTPFGRYCFPQKAYEMLACELPVVAGAVGAMVPLLSSVPDSLYRPEDPADLVRAIEWQLQHRRLLGQPVEDWSTLVGRLEPHLCAVAGVTPA